MSGIVNSLGARSGVIGATVGMPDGAIIQTSDIFQGTTSTTADQGNNTWMDTVVTGTITPTRNTSDILIFSKCHAAMTNTVSDAGYALQFKRQIGSATPTEPTHLSDHASANQHSRAYFYKAADDPFNVIRLTDEVIVMDSPATVEELTYTLQFSTWNMDALAMVMGGNNSRWQIFFQEIARK